jgi:hemoglobin/transferrin/lactoferrin receptor protein
MTHRRFRSVLLACTAVSSISCVTPVVAQTITPANSSSTATEETDLQKIVVKGKRVKQAGDIAQTPLATKTTADQIAKKEIEDLDDLGDTTEPGVSYVAATNSFNIRGLEDDRILTTIDGIPIPYLSDMIRDGYGGTNSFDFSSLSSIDIVHGGDSSMGGSGAVGGAVVLQTLEPEDLIAAGKTYGGIAKTTFDSSDNSFGGSVAYAQRFNDTAILLQGSYKKGHESETSGDIGGTGSSRSEANPLDYDKQSYLLKVRHYVDGEHMFGITAEHYKYNSDESLLQSTSTTYSDYYRPSDTSRDRVSLEYRFDSASTDGLIDSASLSLYWQQVQREEGTTAYRNTAPIGQYDRLSDTDNRTIGVVGAISGNYRTGALDHHVTLGGDLSFASTSQYTSGTDSCSVTYVSGCAYYHINQADMPDVDSTKLGIYLDDRIEIGSSNVAITPGIRFDWYRHDPQDTAAYEANSGYDGTPASTSDYQFSPKLRAEWQAEQQVTFYAQFAMGFKAPNASQLYSNYDSFPQYREVGNPDLEAETSYNFEAGVNLGDEDFGGRISAFSSRYRNFIDVLVEPQAGYSYGSYNFYNRDKVRISGLELNGHKTFTNGINLHAAMTYAKGTDAETGEELASVAPLKAIIGIGYAQEEWGTDVSWIGVKAVSDNSTATFRAPGYGIVNMTGWWEPAQLKGFRVQAGVYNLFDKEYYDALEVKDVSLGSSARSFYSEAGRTFKVSLTQRF